MCQETTSAEALLEVKELQVYYGLVQALSGVSLTVNRGEIVALIGANGAGKSTTLGAIVGMVPVRRGEVYFEGKRIDGIRCDQAVRLGLGCIPERRQLFASMTVIDNLLLGAYCRRGHSSKAEIERDLEQVFELFPVLKQRRKQIAGTLSGGQQQMVAIGRGFMSQPKVLLLDEPSLGLAPIVILEVMQVIKELQKRGMTVLLVEQNAAAALWAADRGYVLENGKVVKEGRASSLMADAEIQSAYLGRVES